MEVLKGQATKLLLLISVPFEHSVRAVRELLRGGLRSELVTGSSTIDL